MSAVNRRASIRFLKLLYKVHHLPGLLGKPEAPVLRELNDSECEVCLDQVSPMIERARETLDLISPSAS